MKPVVYLSTFLYCCYWAIAPVIAAGAIDPGQVLTWSDRFGLGLVIAVLGIVGSIIIIKLLWGLVWQDITETKTKLAALEIEVDTLKTTQRKDLEKRLAQSAISEEKLTASLDRLDKTLENAITTIERLEEANLATVRGIKQRPCQWLESLIRRLDAAQNMQDVKAIVQEGQRSSEEG